MSTPLDDAIADAVARRDRHAVEMVQWHTGEKTGSEFWIRKAAELRLPIGEINGFDDLVRIMPAFDPKFLKTVPPKMWIPRGFNGTKFQWTMFPTGGTTGGPPSMRWGRIGRTPESSDYARDYLEFAKRLPEASFPRNGTVLFLGPGLPRRLPRGIELIAEEFGCGITCVDMDVAWMKDKANTVKGAYKAGLVKRSISALNRLQPDWIFCPPILVQAIAEEPGFDWAKTSVKGILSGGTEMNEETLRFIIEELLQGKIHFIPIFGNALAGLAPSRELSTSFAPIDGEQPYKVIYHPLEPYTVFRVTKKGDPKAVVDPGEVGVLQISNFTTEWFMPMLLERDEARRRNPTLIHPTWGISDVGPSPEMRATMEFGVY